MSESTTTHDVLMHIVRSVVEQPDMVNISTSSAGQDNLSCEVKVGDGDMGRVIGRRGRTADAIRTVVKAVGASEGLRVDVDFVD